MLSKIRLSKMKEILLLQKQDILAQAQRQEKEIDMEGDETDLIQAKMLLEMNARLNTRAADKLKQIENALAKIEDKSYGLCQDCGEDIPEKRLIINPHFQTCVSCAEDRELEQKQRKRV
jgi:DnaK suppressor protein